MKGTFFLIFTNNNFNVNFCHEFSIFLNYLIDKFSFEKLLFYGSPDRADILTKSRRASEIKAKAGQVVLKKVMVCYKKINKAFLVKSLNLINFITFHKLYLIYFGLVAITNFRLFLMPICSTSTKSCTCRLNGMRTTTVCSFDLSIMEIKVVSKESKGTSSLSM